MTAGDLPAGLVNTDDLRLARVYMDHDVPVTMGDGKPKNIPVAALRCADAAELNRTFGEGAGTFMGEVQRQTHAALLPEAERAALERRFSNADMCGITADYVFSKPLDADDPTNKCSAHVADLAAELRADDELRRGVAELREVFLSEKECLIHGDLHTGSVMVPAAGSSGTAKVIDGEFAFYGPAAFDVGTFVANIAFALVSVGDDADARKRCLQMIDMATQTYADEMGMTKSDDQAIFNERVAGFAGCELIRRVIGAAHVDDLELMPAGTAGEERGDSEWAALTLGMQLVKTRSTGSAKLEERVETLLVYP